MNPALHEYILLRDGGCVARFVGSKLDEMRWPMLKGLPDPGPCRNEFGGAFPKTSLLGLYITGVTLDHLKDYATMGGGREDTIDELWALCPEHHGLARVAGHGWALLTPVREAGRIYIAEANRRARERGWPIAPAQA